ncbi:hypothetical protein Rhal01_00051 [Rubritalea halochordaticola]|uniref:DUF1559 domain-containing protein n=1 Tax=Rubritalea halochordaticola TaxID=714537 RepID=A0ABP9UW44_9BACT
MKMKSLALLPLLATSPCVAQEDSPDFHKNLSPVIEKLDTDGEHLAVTYIKDDYKKLAETIDMIGKISQEQGSPFPIQDAEKLCKFIGIDQYVATGSSSKWVGEYALNRKFLATNGKPSGFSTIIGEAKPWSAPSFAPASADLVIETQINLTQLPLAQKQLALALGQEMAEQVTAKMQMPVSPKGLTVQQLSEKLNFRLSLAASLDNSKTWNPSEDVSLPTIDLVGRIDGATWLWDHYGMMVENDSKITEKDGITFYSAPKALPTPMGEVTPVIAVDKAKDQIWFALNMKYLAEAMGDGPKLSSTPHFQAALKSLPSSGNMLAYGSPDAIKSIVNLAEQAKASASSAEEKDIVATLVDAITEKLTASKNGYIFTLQTSDQGILFASKSPMLDKGGPSLPIMLAGVSTLFVGAKYYKDAADESACKVNTNAIHKATWVVQNIEGYEAGDKLTWEMISGDNSKPIPERPTCPAGGTYTLSPTFPKEGEPACRCSHPEHNLSKEETRNW